MWLTDRVDKVLFVQSAASAELDTWFITCPECDREKHCASLKQEVVILLFGPFVYFSPIGRIQRACCCSKGQKMYVCKCTTPNSSFLNNVFLIVVNVNFVSWNNNSYWQMCSYLTHISSVSLLKTFRLTFYCFQLPRDINAFDGLTQNIMLTVPRLVNSQHPHQLIKCTAKHIGQYCEEHINIKLFFSIIKTHNELLG